MKRTILLVWSIVISTAIIGQSSWSMIGGGPDRTSHVEMDFSFPLVIAEQYDIGFSDEDGLTVNEDYICIQSSPDSNVLVVADARTGDSLWHFGIPKTGGSAAYIPAMADGIVLSCGQGADSTRGLDLATGEVKWNLRTSSGYTRCAVISEGHAYIPSGFGLFCVRVNTGEVKWSFDKTIPQIAPVVDSNKVYFGVQDTVYAVNKLSGERVWEEGAPCGTFSSFALDDYRLYVSDYRNEVYAMDNGTGQVLWNIELDTNELCIDYSSAFALTDEYLIVKTLIDESPVNHYRVVDKESGDIVNQFEGNSMSYTSPTMINDYILDLSGGDLEFYEVPSGNLAYTIQTSEFGFTNQVVVANNKIYIGAGGPILTVLESAPSSTSTAIHQARSSIFPNPANGPLTVNYDLATAGDVYIDVYALTGQLALQKEYAGLPAGKGSVAMSVSQLEPGPYTFIISANGAFESHKVIVAR